MKKWQATILLTSLTLGVTQPLATLAAPSLRTTVVAQAATTSDTTKSDIAVEGDYGVHWYLTTSGELHLEAGTLAEPTSSEITGNKGQLVTQIALKEGKPASTEADLNKVGEQVTKVVLDGPVATSSNATNLFAQFGFVSEYVNLDKLDTSAATTMKGMFLSGQSFVDPADNKTKTGNNVLQSLDVSHFDTSHVTDMSFMFYQLRKVSNLDLSHFNTDNVTTTMSMFVNDASLQELDMSKLTFASLKSALYMFSGSNVQILRLDSFAPPADFSGSSMFNGKTNLWQLTLGPKTIFKSTSTYLNDPNTMNDDEFLHSWEAVGEGTVQNPLGERYAKGAEVAALYSGDHNPTSVETYVWEPAVRVIEPVTPPVTPPDTQQGQPVTVKYVDAQGKKLADDQVLTGTLGATYTAERLAISGYKLSTVTGDESGTFGSTPTTVTFHYAADLSTGGSGATVVPITGVLYAKKTINLYSSKNFSKKTKKVTYRKQKRTNRPMFVVTGNAKSKQGYRRYKVRDVNHHSKTAGKTGYITAKSAYVSSVYYAKKQNKVKVLNAKGVNAYKQKSLKGKVRHYKKGQTLKVKKIVSYKKTTRFQLTNGKYVTANKKLVIAQK
ncbi:DUF5776 domain-containing protein [Levilactobacillus paucivorans]|nr:DUF5776 domain-containing protein [Levilactobacillus paucivorans]